MMYAHKIKIDMHANIRKDGMFLLLGSSFNKKKRMLRFFIYVWCWLGFFLLSACEFDVILRIRRSSSGSFFLFFLLFTIWCFESFFNVVISISFANFLSFFKSCY